MQHSDAWRFGNRRRDSHSGKRGGRSDGNPRPDAGQSGQGGDQTAEVVDGFIAIPFKT